MYWSKSVIFLCCGKCSQPNLSLMTERALYQRIVASVFGLPLEGATLLLCDATSALRAAMGESSVMRMRHELRRLAIVTQHVADGEIALGHLPDAVNFIDFLTKWVKQAKVEESVAYLTGAVARAAHAGGNASGSEPHEASAFAAMLQELIEEDGDEELAEMIDDAVERDEC